MKLLCLFGQRKCRYEGEYAPELLNAVDEFTMDVNPDYIRDAHIKADESGDFSAVALVIVDLGSEGMRAIEDRLNGVFTVKGTVEPGGLTSFS